ncbi:unnamed protein product [Moneuplotes crassus]|uniref:Uncharacterized protein n=1 Tax=Euplotes crassus TaxID=5936 RepID=A0AAD1X7K6_EUPCR|nr:unnamed protein product [Moneuplotes crassus]
MKQPQAQSSLKTHPPCAAPSDPKEESKTLDVSVPTSIVLDMSKESDKKRLEGMDESELENMESIKISNLDKIEMDSFFIFAAKIPRGLKSLKLQFTLSVTNVHSKNHNFSFPHLDSILSLSSKITEKLVVYCNGMNSREKSKISFAFNKIEVEYYGKEHT